MRITKLFTAALLGVLLNTSVLQSLKAEGVSNLDPSIPVFASSDIKFDVWNAAQFTTGSASSYSLTQITLGMDPALDATGNFFVALYSDSPGGGPTALLSNGLLVGSASPTAGGNIDYLPGVGGITLAANTSYWIVVGVDTDGGGTYLWQFPDTGATYIGDTGWSILDGYAGSTDQGDTWEVNPVGGTYKIAVVADAVPEPSTYVLMLIGGTVLLWQMRRKQLSAQR